MIVLLSEISKCLNKKLQIETVSESLTMIGLEVESIREVSLSSLDPHIVVGNIKKIVKHPNADKLQLCEVDSGEGALDIVCGANNIKVGDNVPLAKIGAKLSKSEKLPNGLNIKKSKIREVESYGMLCSSSELGLGYEYEDGIFILAADLNPGEVISKISDLNDFIIDISVTPNRGDCLSVFGICRGFQLLNIYLGGTLFQDILTQRKDSIMHRDTKEYDQLTHDIDVVDGNLLHKLSGSNRLHVNSVHHQAINAVADKLDIMAMCTEDGVIEALSYRNSPDGKVMGVQWHPEFFYNSRTPLFNTDVLFKEFLGFIK